MNRNISTLNPIRSLLLTMAFTLPATAAELDSTRETLAQKTLEKLPRYTNAEALSFSVPYPVIQAFFMDTLFPGRTNGPPPLARLVRSEWEAQVAITNQAVEVIVEMKVQVLDASPLHPVMLELFPENTVYEELTLDEEKVTPIKSRLANVISGNFLTQQTVPSSNLTLPLTREGTHHIRARIKPTVSLQGGGGLLQLFQANYALAHVDIKADAALEVRVEGAPGTLRGSADLGTTGSLALMPTESRVLLSWEPVRESAVRTGIPSYSTTAAWTIEERALTARALMDIRITGGTREQLTLNLPSGADRVSITGADVREAQINGSTATVFLKGRIQGATQLQVTCTIPGAVSSTVTLPHFDVQGGRATEGGWLTVANDVGGELLEHSISGLETAAARALPPEASGLAHATPTYVYRCTSRSPSAAFERIQTVPFPLVDTIADVAEAQCIVRPDGEELVKLHYDMRNNRAQYLRMKLPNGARLLTVSVEKSVCIPSTANGEVLIPLPRSLQTMDGLVSFPVELVYVRKGAPIEGQERRTVDLPELLDVPSAKVSVTLFLPKELKLKQTYGPLQQVDKVVSFASQELASGSSFAPTGNAPPPERELYRNYYNLGLDAYKANDFESAERYLGQAVAWNGGEDRNADALLSNIKVTSGSASISSGKDQAKAAFITRATKSSNVQQSGEQGALIEEGLALFEEGDEIGGAELLEQADKLGSQLSARGDMLGQRTLRISYGAQLDQVKSSQAENVKLKEQVEQLQRSTQALVAKERESGKGERFVANLNAAAMEYDYDNFEAEELVFAEKQTVEPPATGSIEEQNQVLSQQVAVLEKAFTLTEENVAPETGQRTFDIVGNAQLRLQQTRQEVIQIQNELNEADAQLELGQATLSDVGLSEKLDALKRRRTAISNVYNSNDSLQRDIKQLDELIDESEQKLQQVQQQRQQARQVVVEDSQGWLAGNTTYQKQQLAELIVSNNDFVEAEEDRPLATPLVGVTSGKLATYNVGRNSIVLNDAVNNLALNSGNLVSVAGGTLDASFLKDGNAVSALFSEQTEQGQRYAVLDEAQYRTLQGMQQRAPEVGQRAVVPNTWNQVAGQRFQLQETAPEYNAINIDGTVIELEHEHYLALDNGDHITILKGSAEHDWQEQVDLTTELAPPVETLNIVFPAVGVPYRFEKTLLAENESMDMEIEYRLAKRD